MPLQIRRSECWQMAEVTLPAGGNGLLQIRRSDGWRMARVTLPAVAMGCCVFNSLIFKFLYEKTAVGEDGGFCVTEKFDNSGIYGKSLLHQP